MTNKLSYNDAFQNVEAELLAAPLGVSKTGDTNTWTDEFHNVEDRGLYTGYWRCEPGVSDWDFSDNGEVIYVIEGKAIITEEGGSPVEIGPGDSAAFPKGWKGTWEITETLSKFYVIYE